MDSIKKRRERLGWSQYKLAARAGVTTMTVQAAESGRWAKPYSLPNIERALAEGEAEREKGTKP